MVGKPGMLQSMGLHLVGYSPWGRKESDTTERLHFTSLQMKDMIYLVVKTGEVIIFLQSVVEAESQ